VVAVEALVMPDVMADVVADVVLGSFAPKGPLGET